MAICTCGRVLAVRREAASHLWVSVVSDSKLALSLKD
jgi:hypothetical protein